MKREQRASIVRARGSKTLSFQIFEATKRETCLLDSRVVSHELGGVEPLRLFSVRPVLVIEQVFQLLYSSLIGCRRERERERERENGCISSVCARKEHSLQRFLRSDLKIDLRSSWREKKRTKKTNSKERKKEKRGIASRVDLYLLPSVFQVDHFLVRERHPFFSSLCSSFVVKVVYVVV